MTGIHAVSSEPDVFSSLVLVDITPRPAAAGVSRILEFMAKDAADGFTTLDDAADAIAAYQPHRPRPADLSGLAKNLRLGDDGRWRWHWDPAFLDLRTGGTSEHARDQDTACLGTEGGSSEGAQGGGEGREVLDGAGEDGVSVWREERGGVAWGREPRGIRWLVEKLRRDMPTSVGEVAAAVLRQLEARHGEQVPHTRSLTHSLTHSPCSQKALYKRAYKRDPLESPM